MSMLSRLYQLKSKFPPRNRSLLFSKRAGTRFGWFNHWGSYIPPVFSFLTAAEWKIIEQWYEDTEKQNLRGESNVPFMSILQGFVMGSSIPRIVQLGHYAGFSTILLGMMLRKMQLKNSFVTIDIDRFCCDYTRGWMDKAHLNEYVRVEEGDSRDPQVAAAVRQYLRDMPNVVIIDSSHQYACTLQELELWYGQLKENGFIFLHDSSPFAEAFDSTNQGGVKKALEEFCRMTPSAKCINIYNSWNRTYEDPWDPAALYKDPCGIGIIQKPA